MNSFITKFSTSVFFWFKGKVEVDDNFCKTKVPNNILGLIPMGSDTQNIPLKNISAVTVSKSVSIKQIIIGAILGLFFVGSIISLPIALIFWAYALSGIKSVLVIQRAGADYLISVPFWESGKLNTAAGIIEQALVQDTAKTDLNQFFDKKQTV